MCTVSWLHQGEGYQLLCNRDEKRTRAPAAGPAIKSRHGVRFVAPTDQAAGGTWIAINEFGISLCLLNGAGAQEAPKSRGLLLPELQSAGSLAEVRERVRNCDLSLYAPFTLAILEPGGRTAVLEWDGRTAVDAEPRAPLVSSSFDPEGVRFERRKEFNRRLQAAGKLDASVLVGFHRTHGTRADAYSACMHRSDAETVSFSWVKVTKSQITFFYLPAAPCRRGRGETVVLNRVPQGMRMA